MFVDYALSCEFENTRAVRDCIFEKQSKTTIIPFRRFWFAQNLQMRLQRMIKHVLYDERCRQNQTGEKKQMEWRRKSEQFPTHVIE